MIRDIIIAILVIVLFLLLVIYPNADAHAQAPHHHPTETIYGPTAEFYRTWKRPDVPSSSCCSDKDCYSTRIRRRSGKIQAVHRESGDWIDIPSEKIELDRDSPDGLSHMCASPEKFVFCFKEGGGT
jgi:hypothetical protein